ncbi:Golgin imh1 [Mycoemilia scoparia]|uniref:Golgin imh1 n=1 Tax=Mycoemilia scoparia TaxID=417184 RepID=A0A9W8A1I2_9FUNG|nr:Golgin imh1 [Mycoemilia scoparia]
MSDPNTSEGPGTTKSPPPQPTENAAQSMVEGLSVGMPLTEDLIARLGKVEKYEKKLTDLARAYKGLNAARRKIEIVLQKETPISSIVESEDLENYLKGLNTKAQLSHKEISRLTESEKLLQGMARQLRTSLSNEKEAYSELQEHKVQLQRDLDLSRKEMQVMKGQLTRLREKSTVDNASLKEKVDVLTSENVSLQAKCARLNQNQDSKPTLQICVDQLVEYIESEDNKDVINDDRLAKLREALEIPSDKDTVSLNEFNETKKKLDELTKISNDYNDLNTEKYRLENELKKVTSSKESIEEEYSTLKTDLEINKKEVSELKEKIAKKEKQLDDYAKELDVAKSKVKGSDSNSQKSTDKERPKEQESKNKTELSEQKIKEIVKACLTNKLQIIDDNKTKQQSPAQASNKSGKKKGKSAKNQNNNMLGSGSIQATHGEAKALFELLEELRKQGIADKDNESNSAGENINIDSKDIAVLRQNLHEATEKHATLEKEIKTIVSERDELEVDLKLTKDELDKAKQQLKNEEAKLQGLQTSYDDLGSKYKNTETKYNEAKKESATLKEQVETAQKELKDVKTRIADLEKQTEEYKNEKKFSRGEVAKLRATIDALRTEKGMVSEKLESAKTAATKAELELKRRDDQLRRLKEELADQTNLTKQFQEQLTKAEGDLASFQEASDEAHSKVQGKENEINQLKKKVDGLQKNIENHSKQISEKEYFAAQQEVRVKELETEIAEQKQAIQDEADRAKESINELLEEARFTQKSLNETIDEKDRQIDSLQARVDELTSNKHNNIDNNIAKNKASQGDIGRSEREWEEMKQRQAEAESELELMRTNLRDAEEDRVQARVKTEQLEAIKTELKQVKDQLSWSNENYKVREDRWRQIIQGLKNELRQLQHKLRAQESSTKPASSPAAPNNDQLSSLKDSKDNADNSEESIQTALFGSNPSRLVRSSYSPKTTASEQNSQQSTPSVASFSSGTAENIQTKQQQTTSSANVDYLRHVLFTFVKDKHHRKQLVPVLSALLECSLDDIKILQKHIT